jgi:hypothetical protein
MRNPMHNITSPRSDDDGVEREIVDAAKGDAP